MALKVREKLPFASLPGFSALFQNYISGEGEAQSFFKHDWRGTDGLEAAAADAAARPRDRQTLVTSLLATNERIGALDDSAAANIDRLADDDSVAIVTGQQLGLFGGPLYTFYKTCTAVAVADRLTRETGRPHVPVFWLEGEDHDFAEIRATNIPGRGASVSIAVPEADPERIPVGQRDLIGVPEALQSLEAELDSGPFLPEVVALLRKVYQPESTWVDAFGSLMARLFAGTGLVFIWDGDPDLKSLGKDLFEQEIAQWQTTLRSLTEVSERLVNTGYHAQVTPMPVNLFLLLDEGRLALDPEGEGFTARGTVRQFSHAEVLAMARTSPEVFSPNVVTRPVFQDVLLPTAAYVAGPGEIAYFAQLQPVYEHFRVPMPVVYPRMSATLVPPTLGRILDEYELSLGDLTDGPDRLAKRIVLNRASIDIRGEFDDVRKQIQSALERAADISGPIDKTLRSSAEATFKRMERDLDKLIAKTVRAEMRSQSDVANRIHRLAATVYPGGLQERTLSILSFLADYGPQFVRELCDSMPVEFDNHLVIDL
jgi:bacillithiol synthase